MPAPRAAQLGESARVRYWAVSCAAHALALGWEAVQTERCPTPDRWRLSKRRGRCYSRKRLPVSADAGEYWGLAAEDVPTVRAPAGA
jgi:hypothetical protein